MISFPLGIVAGFLSAIIAAGPVSFILLHHALSHQYKKSMCIALGATAMEIIYLSIAVFSVSSLLSLFSIHPFARVISRSIGIFLLLALGIHFISSIPKLTAKPLSFNSFFPSTFFGLSLVFLNPSIILTWSSLITLLHSFFLLSLTSFSDKVLFIAGAGAGMFLGSMTLIFLGDQYKNKLSQRTMHKVLRLSGWFLIFLSIALFISLLISTATPL